MALSIFRLTTLPTKNSSPVNNGKIIGLSWARVSMKPSWTTINQKHLKCWQWKLKTFVSHLLQLKSQNWQELTKLISISQKWLSTERWMPEKNPFYQIRPANLHSTKSFNFVCYSNESSITHQKRECFGSLGWVRNTLLMTSKDSPMFMLTLTPLVR